MEQLTRAYNVVLFTRPTGSTLSLTKNQTCYIDFSGNRTVGEKKTYKRESDSGDEDVRDISIPTVDVLYFTCTGKYVNLPKIKIPHTIDISNGNSSALHLNQDNYERYCSLPVSFVKNHKYIKQDTYGCMKLQLNEYYADKGKSINSRFMASFQFDKKFCALYVHNEKFNDSFPFMTLMNERPDFITIHDCVLYYKSIDGIEEKYKSLKELLNDILPPDHRVSIKLVELF